MIEQLSLSVSTLLFFLCTAVVGSFFPQSQDTVSFDEYAVTVSAVKEAPSLVGKWYSNGHTIEFTKDGKLIYNGIMFDYTQNGRMLTVSVNIGGEVREYSAIAEEISERTVRINGISMYRTE